jgi:hypothetical protein
VGNRTHVSMENAARTRLGFFRLIKGGQRNSNSDRVLVEVAHKRFCRPIPTVVSGTLDALRQAFVDRALEVNLHGGSKAATTLYFAKATPNRKPGPDAKTEKAAADKRKAADVRAAAAATTVRARPIDAPKSPLRSHGVARRADSCSSSSNYMRHRVWHNRRDWSSRELYQPWRSGQVQERPTPQALQPRDINDRRYSTLTGLPSHALATPRSMRSMGARTLHPLCLAHVSRPQARRQQVAAFNRHDGAEQLRLRVQHVLRDPQAPSPFVAARRLLRIAKLPRTATACSAFEKRTETSSP